jgi:hypothetical protein
MGFNVNSLLKDKIVLYIVLFFSVTNFFGYILLDNYDAVITMVLIGLFASYFSKNMIVILLSSILGGTIVTGATTINTGFKEGLKISSKKKSATTDKPGISVNPKYTRTPDPNLPASPAGRGQDGIHHGHTDKQHTETFTDDDEDEETDQENSGVSGASEETDDIEAGKDPTEIAMGNLDKILGGNAANSLIQNQNHLMKNMENLEPLMTQASAMLEKLNGSGLIEGVGSLANNLAVGKK